MRPVRTKYLSEVFWVRKDEKRKRFSLGTPGVDQIQFVVIFLLYLGNKSVLAEKEEKEKTHYSQFKKKQLVIRIHVLKIKL